MEIAGNPLVTYSQDLCPHNSREKAERSQILEVCVCVTQLNIFHTKVVANFRRSFKTLQHVKRLQSARAYIQHLWVTQ